jgi:hypothetical protein
MHDIQPLGVLPDRPTIVVMGLFLVGQAGRIPFLSTRHSSSKLYNPLRCWHRSII